MEFNNNQPIYIQIMNLIKSQIASEEIEQGDKLPSVRELSKKLKVNPNTVQRVYQELEREDIVFTQRGTGTFISKDEGLVETLKYGTSEEVTRKYLEDMNNLGFKNDQVIEIVDKFIKAEEV